MKKNLRGLHPVLTGPGFKADFTTARLLGPVNRVFLVQRHAIKQNWDIFNCQAKIFLVILDDSVIDDTQVAHILANPLLLHLQLYSVKNNQDNTTEVVEKGEG